MRLFFSCIVPSSVLNRLSINALTVFISSDTGYRASHNNQFKDGVNKIWILFKTYELAI